MATAALSTLPAPADAPLALTAACSAARSAAAAAAAAARPAAATAAAALAGTSTPLAHGRRGAAHAARTSPLSAAAAVATSGAVAFCARLRQQLRQYTARRRRRPASAAATTRRAPATRGRPVAGASARAACTARLRAGPRPLLLFQLVQHRALAWRRVRGYTRRTAARRNAGILFKLGQHAALRGCRGHGQSRAALLLSVARHGRLLMIIVAGRSSIGAAALRAPPPPGAAPLRAVTAACGPMLRAVTVRPVACRWLGGLRACRAPTRGVRLPHEDRGRPDGGIRRRYHLGRRALTPLRLARLGGALGLHPRSRGERWNLTTLGESRFRRKGRTILGKSRAGAAASPKRERDSRVTYHRTVRSETHARRHNRKYTPANTIVQIYIHTQQTSRFSAVASHGNSSTLRMSFLSRSSCASSWFFGQSTLFSRSLTSGGISPM